MTSWREGTVLIVLHELNLDNSPIPRQPPPAGHYHLLDENHAYTPDSINDPNSQVNQVLHVPYFFHLILFSTETVSTIAELRAQAAGGTGDSVTQDHVADPEDGLSVAGPSNIAATPTETRVEDGLSVAGPSDIGTTEETGAAEDPRTPIKNPKKRTPQVDNWKSTQRKKRNTGQEYTGKRGELHEAREMKALPNHRCNRNCSKISEDERKSIFEQYWALGDFDVQLSWICGLVKQIEPKRRYGGDDHQSRRGLTRLFYLNVPGQGSISVCKTYFVGTLGISNGHLDRALKKQRDGHGVPGRDQRGRKTPPNKLPVSDVEYVMQHISSFPRHSSHYTRGHQLDRKFLSPELNLKVMYTLYVEKCIEEGRSPVKEWAYRSIFNTKFNLSFHAPRKDTCKVCDKLENDISSNPANKQQLLKEKEVHLRKAEKARTALKDDSASAKNNQSMNVITFDLQKTLPTPMLPTNEVYYKRQLSVYNLGIHSQKDDVAHMYMWHEGQASRGPNEIGSCILHHLTHNEVGITHLTAYSDSCGGQNRNYKMAVLWMYIVINLNIELVDHKFLVSGHSYLPNDQDFGLIEKAKKKKEHVFVPEDWHAITREAKRKKPRFDVIPMTADMFYSTKPLEEATVNRKVDEDNQKVEWLKMQWMQFRKEDPGVMYFKNTCDNDVPFYKVDFKQRRLSRGRQPKLLEAVKDLPVLYPDGRGLKKAKLNDIRSLLKYVPPIHHPFYDSLSATMDGQQNDSDTASD